MHRLSRVASSPLGRPPAVALLAVSALVAAGGCASSPDPLAVIEPGGVVAALALSPGEDLLAIAHDGFIDLWPLGAEAAPGPSRVGRLELMASVRDLAFSPDGRWLAVATVAPGVRLLDVARPADAGAIAPRTIAPDAPAVAVAWSPDGGSLAVAHEGAVGLHDAASGARTRTLAAGGEHPLAGVAFTSDGARIITCSNEVLFVRARSIAPLVGGSPVALWDAATGAPAGRLPELRAAGPLGPGIVRVAGDRVASLSGPLPAVWSLATGARVLCETADSDRDAPRLVGSLALTPDGRRLAAALSDGSVRIFDAERGVEALRLEASDVPVLAVAFAAGGRRVLAGGLDGRVRIWALPPPA